MERTRLMVSILLNPQPEISSAPARISSLRAIMSGTAREAPELLKKDPMILRPANYPEGAEGKGFSVMNRKGVSVCVINLIGRTFMQPVDCPFRKFDVIYREVKGEADIIIVDFHAESTSEKQAFGWYVDGRASAVYGTHTHVQTADEKILTRGTGYITDAGNDRRNGIRHR